MREVVLYCIEVSSEGELILRCVDDGANKSFRMSSIRSEIEFQGKKYDPAAFLSEGLGISQEACHDAIRTALACTQIKDNFTKYFGEQLGNAAPLWSGNAELVFKFQKSQISLLLKCIFLLGEDDYYLWGYSTGTSKFVFIPLAHIEGRIKTNDTSFQKKTFLPKFLGIA